MTDQKKSHTNHLSLCRTCLGQNHWCWMVGDFILVQWKLGPFHEFCALLRGICYNFTRCLFTGLVEYGYSCLKFD